MQQSQALSNAGGSAQQANQAYMAARGATPISTLGSASSRFNDQLNLANQQSQAGSQPMQGLQWRSSNPVPGSQSPQTPNPNMGGLAAANAMGLSKTDVASQLGRQALMPPQNQGQTGVASAAARGPMAAKKKVLVPGAAPQPSMKGRTSSMQRRGIGAGQVPGQAPPTRRGGPVTPAAAAQNFIQGRKYANPAPTPPTPDGGAQAVLPPSAPASAPTGTVRAAAPTVQPAPKPVTV
jgi:hypothetical protein